jgi:hypothetical protein
MKISKPFKKWILPVVVSIFLAVVIYYMFFIKNTKEGQEDMGNFHSKISYSKFETLSESQKKKFGPPFDALKNFINTNFKNALSINELKNRSESDKYQLSTNKRYLKWTLKSGTEYFFEITDKTLTPINKVRSNVSSKIDDCIIVLTKKEFDDALKNDLFQGIDTAIKPMADSLLDNNIIEMDGEKQIANPILRGLYNNESFRLYISCNDIDSKIEFKDSPHNQNGSYKDIRNDEERNLYNVLTDYLLNEKLITSDIKDPYFYFEIVHDNLNILYDTIKDIINNKDSKKQFSIWVGTENTRRTIT